MRTILVPTSVGASTVRLLDEAVAEAGWRQASILLLHVLDLPLELPIAPPVEASLTPPHRTVDAIEQSARAELEALATTLPAHVARSIRVEYGAPWRVICDVANSEDVALVMIGARAHRLLDGLLGTTASRVVNHCDRSVLVVRDDASAQPVRTSHSSRPPGLATEDVVASARPVPTREF